MEGRKKPTDSQIMLRELVRFFLDVKIHEHATYFVDSLWDHTDVLRVNIGKFTFFLNKVLSVCASSRIGRPWCPCCWMKSVVLC